MNLKGICRHKNCEATNDIGYASDASGFNCNVCGGHNNVGSARKRYNRFMDSQCGATPAPVPKPDLSHAPADYPDGNPKSLQGAKKYSLRYLPLPASIEVNRALADGAVKYGPANWRQSGVAATVYVDAAMRHLAQWFDGGQKNAADSGVHNLGHAMACLAIIIDAEANGKLIDDRPFACVDTDALLLKVPHVPS